MTTIADTTDSSALDEAALIAQATEAAGIPAAPPGEVGGRGGRINIALDPELRRRLRIRAVIDGCDMKDVVTAALLAYLGP